MYVTEHCLSSPYDSRQLHCSEFISFLVKNSAAPEGEGLAHGVGMLELNRDAIWLQ